VTEKTTAPNDDREITRAAALLRAGRLVAFPTETVYGLGANALDPAAVDRIFEAKGRPAASPLIVHVASIHLARLIVAEWPARADLLAHRFWPGPLTLVLKKHANIPERVTAGLNTVGIRVPAHPVALAMLRAAGVPVAAPSANLFGAAVPHASRARAGQSGRSSGHDSRWRTHRCGNRIDGVVHCRRAGAAAAGHGFARADRGGDRTDKRRRRGSCRWRRTHRQGLHTRHYSPSERRLVLLSADDPLPSGRGAYMFTTSPRSSCKCVPMPSDADGYAAALYRTLHELDGEGHQWIAVELPPDGAAWVAIHDRLTRAAASR
jgi:L-threonylcarbamoyladenylate synthase